MAFLTGRYKKIWHDEDPPLVYYSKALQKKLNLPSLYVVEIGMRYGKPSIPQALSKLMEHNITDLIVLPMFPQYASASTGSALACTFDHLKKLPQTPRVTTVEHFYDKGFFLKPLQKSISDNLQRHKPDFLLFSYHGLPLHQLPCHKPPASCPEAKAHCYHSHCLQTTRHLVSALQLSANCYATSFQSRLGRMPWLTPYTDEIAVKLAAKGVRHLGVVCPSFTADCLETLEEVGMRLRLDFIHAGGKELTLFPALNDNDTWANSLASFLIETRENLASC